MTSPAPRPLTRSQQRKERRIRTRWYRIPEGRSVYAAVPRRSRIVQDGHSGNQERIYAWADALPASFRTPDKGWKVVRFSYNEVKAKCAVSYSTARRCLRALQRKHSLRIFEVEHPGGRRAGGEGNNKPTYYVIPPWPDVLAMRAQDRTIGKDKRGWVYVLGGGKRFLSPQEIDLWRLNDDYDVLPRYASVSTEASVELAAWEAAHPEESPQQPRLQPVALFAEPPPGPAQPGAIPEPIAEVLRRYDVVVEAPRLWKFVGEVRRHATRLGHAQLSHELLARIMDSRAAKTEKVRSFGFFVTAVPAALKEELEKTAAQLELEQRDAAHRAQIDAEAKAAYEREQAEQQRPEYWRGLIDQQKARIHEARELLRDIDAFHPDHGKLKREIATMKAQIELWERTLGNLGRSSGAGA